MTDTHPTATTSASQASSASSKTSRANNLPRDEGKAKKTDKIPEAAADCCVSKAPTKLDQLIGLLSRPEGASIDELCATSGWQPHSVRGAMAGALKKKGHVIASEKQDGVRRYSIGAGS